MILEKRIGFSLIEILVALIIVSIITAALAPVITKKLSSAAVTIGESGTSEIEFQMDCSAFSEDCALCFEDKCTLCTKECLDNEFTSTPDCLCKLCNSEDGFKDCEQCTAKKCKKCANGYYLENGICKSCSDNYYCNGLEQIICPKGHYCQNGIAYSCPTNTYNDLDGQNSSDVCKSCSSKTANCSSCDIETGTCTTCKSGYILNATATCEVENPCGNKAVLITLSNRRMCITKYNIGDGGFAIPSSINVVGITNTSATWNGPYCWQGQTSGICNDADARYSGCYRTVCNYPAAQIGCAYLTYNGLSWSIPTSNDWSQIISERLDVLIGNGTSSLLFCTAEANGANSTCAIGGNKCASNIDDDCIVHFTWAKETFVQPDDGVHGPQGHAYTLNTYQYNAGIGDRNTGAAASAICVSYIN